MTQLTETVDASDEVWTIDTMPSSPYLQVEDELVEIRARYPEHIYQPTQELIAPKIRVRRAFAGTTAASHADATTLTPAYGVGGAAGDAEGGVAVLEDPGNVWEPSIVVAIGYRIAETIEGESRVFEVTTGGTTNGDGGTTLDDVTDAIDFTSGALVPEAGAGGVVWRHLGIVGDLPWTVLPGLPAQIAVDPETRAVSIISPEPPGESERIFTLDATVDDVRVPVWDVKGDGDADWNLDINAGAGFRFNVSEDGVPDDLSGKVEFTTEGFRVYTPTQTFAVTFDPFTITMVGLPAANPNVAGRLYTDGAPSAGVGKALMVSGG